MNQWCKYRSKLGCFFILTVAAVISQNALAQQPFLAFSDLISGPDTGLDDGKGSGVVVTLWGQNLGPARSENKVFYVDSSGVSREAAHIYYWKNADGTLPSGPANLYESHKMQEIAVSIPDSAEGLGSIYVEVNEERSNALPFIVRPGEIFHVKRSGSDSGDGSWNNPWLTVSKADGTAPAGSTIYVHDVDTGSFDNPTPRAIYWNRTSSSSSLAAQFSIVAFPNYQPKVIAQRAVEKYTTEGLVVSKLDIYASNYTNVDEYGQMVGPQIDSIKGTAGISASKNGRAVANRIGDIPGGCASSQAGAIVGSAQHEDNVSNFKALGNEIYDYGCNGSSKLHHTTYLTVRSGTDLQVEPWEWGYNYLHGNKAKFGIHNYDERSGCGDLTDTLRIYNNVIVDQAGAGISVGAACEWTMDVEIENNVLINVGLAAAWDGKDPATSDGAENGGISIRDNGLSGTMFIRHNTVYKHTQDRPSSNAGCLQFQGTADNVNVVWQNNTCLASLGVGFVGVGYGASNKLDNVVGSSNIWYQENGGANLKAPDWDSKPLLVEPQINVMGAKVSLERNSPAINQGIGNHPRDIYGVRRDGFPDIGAVEFLGAAPNPPSQLDIN